ncbi:hypothetical protein LHA01_16730 [Schleiferilactobacillus harbinensis]|nr:hypothetical protein LHA01_16730 [Schleiferilactobacillus harbinensis]
MSFHLTPEELARWINLLSPDDLARVKKDLRQALVHDQIDDHLQQILNYHDDDTAPSRPRP